jgi:hypothetical protein
MDDSEAERAYSMIEEVLRKNELSWVADQVNESIELGNTEIKRADASDFIDDQVAGKRRGRKRMQDFVTTVSFSNVERLGLLLDAIKRLMALQDFEANALQILEADDVKFMPEQDRDEAHSLRRARTDEQEHARSRLSEVLKEMQGTFS